MLNKIQLAFFDIDETLHEGETIWEILHKKNHTWDSHGAKYWQMYLDKKIDYEEFAKLDAACWKGMPEKTLHEALDELKLFEEVEQLFEKLLAKNIKVYLISNSLSHMAQKIVQDFKLTGFHANDLIVVDGKLTGEIRLNIKYNDKGIIVRQILDQPENQGKKSLAIGDSNNDLPMLKAVDFPVLYNPKNKVFKEYTGFTARTWQEILDYIIMKK